MQNTWERLLGILILFLALPAFADISSVLIETANSNVTTSYTSTPALSATAALRVLVVENSTAKRIAVNCNGLASTAPSNTDSKNIYVNSGSSKAIDAALTGQYCYVRSLDSTISSGVITLEGAY